MTNFTDLGLSPKLLTAVTAAGYDKPTPIQARAIPLIIEGRDLMGLAQTGTGKTAAFGLPLINRLMSQTEARKAKSVKALILAPTRELVNQIAENLSTYVSGSHLKVVTVVGGASINTQIKRLAGGTDILVATPGRLIDLVDRRALFLNSATYLVLDEADQMLDLGFIHALRKIAPLLGTPRQTLLFSATMPKQMNEISAAYLTNPARIQVAPPGKAADKVAQSLHFASQGEKTELLMEYLRKSPEGLALVFGRTKHGSEKLKNTLVARGFDAVSIHGNKSQGQRERALKAFKSGEARILVATDVAARGIDIPDVSHVYNYDLPEVPENYVHRIGRTARAGKDGEAIAFCAATEIGYLRQIEKIMKTEIKVIGGIRPAEEKPEPRGGNRGGRKGQPHGGNKARPHTGGGGRRNTAIGKPSGGKPNQQRRRRSARKPAA